MLVRELIVVRDQTSAHHRMSVREMVQMMDRMKVFWITRSRDQMLAHQKFHLRNRKLVNEMIVMRDQMLGH